MLQRNHHLRERILQAVKYVLVLVGVVLLYSTVFQVIMVQVEGERHSWMAAVYWTLMVMSTLGFGDIAFESDIGRLFTVVVLTSGVVQLMILLPFVFIRFSPWLERMMQIKPPNSLPVSMANHVIITSDKPVITSGLMDRLFEEDIQAFIIQPDYERAVQQYIDGVSVVSGEPDTTTTYEAMQVNQARIVVVNDVDTNNANAILTIREVAPDIPIVSLAQYDHSVDVLELSGANHVLPLKRWLGEQLANRACGNQSHLSEIGTFENLSIVELPVYRSSLVNKTVRETKLRELTGVSIIGIWEGSRLKAISSDQRLLAEHVMVLAGTIEQLSSLGNEHVVAEVNTNPVLIIGGGRVGIAAARRLREKGMRVYMVEKDASLLRRLEEFCDRVFVGDAAEYQVLSEAGIMSAPSVVITTNDDAVNIYLASYCRHLNGNMRIVSRITHERNLEAIHRAGADLVLRYSSLGIEAILATIENRSMLLLGEDIQLYTIETLGNLAGHTLAESQIGAETSMIVLAIQKDGHLEVNPHKSTLLTEDSILYVLGSVAQRNLLRASYGAF